MARSNTQIVTFNRGRISPLGLARVDLKRTLLSAEMQRNFIPRTLGSMMLRPGMQYIGSLAENLSTGRCLPFIFSATNVAVLTLTDSALQVWIDDTLVVRTSSTANVGEADFSSSALAAWTDADETGATSGWLANSTAVPSWLPVTSFLTLAGTRYARAKRYQTVTALAGTYGLDVRIGLGKVNLRIGSSVGGDNYFNEKLLTSGSYDLSITTTGTFTVEFSANTEYRSLVAYCEMVPDPQTIASSTMTLSAPWQSSDLGNNLGSDQSADVLFLAIPNMQPMRIERHAAQSWAVTEYRPEDGPFRTINVTNTRITPSARTGEITLEADRSLFKSGHIGGLFRLTSVGQAVSITPSGIDQWSDAIRVAGVSEGRLFQILVTSSTGFSATVRVQRSIGEEGSWANVNVLTFTSTIDSTHDDGLANQIIFYRIGVGSTYTSGSPACTLNYASGGLTGVVRITGSTGSTTASAIVLDSLGSTAATELWEEGEWSTLRGFPSAVTLHEGRLWWAGKSKIWGSVSDAFESFNPDTEGDSGPINRSIATGGVDTVQWLRSLGRLIVGTESRELQAKTGSIDEPLTPTNFNLRDISGQGSAPVQAVKLDTGLLFVQTSKTRVMQTVYASDILDYKTLHRTILVPEIGEPSIARMAVQRQPDTRVHCVRGDTDGTVAMLIDDPIEEVSAWVDIASTAAAGFIEDVAILPGAGLGEDQVYYVVRRTINGTVQRYLEKFAFESQARGGSSNRMADSFVIYNGTATTIISATHLAGSSVIAWGATADLGSYTCSSSLGQVTLSQATTYACVGLPYEAWYKSAKLAYATEHGTALLQRKRVNHLGLALAYTHAQGLQYGPSTNSTDLDSLPLMEAGTSISTDVVNATYDYDTVEFNGEWNTDSRIVLRAVAPRPCTVLGAVIQIETREKT